MQNTVLEIAGKKYDVAKLPIKANREWRNRFDEPVNQLLGMAQAIKGLTGTQWETPQEMLTNVGLVLATHIEEITRVLLGSVDMVVDAVFAYSPVLEADRDHIEAEGFDEEMVGAFVEVMKLAYPFSSVVKSLTKLGEAAKVSDGTSQNSPLPSGESMKTN